MKKRSQGFTLIELVVVMAIIAVLAVLVIGAITIARNMVKETQHRTDARTVQVWLESYFSKKKTYPDWSYVSPGTYRTLCFTEFQSKVQALGDNIQLLSSPDDYSYYGTPCGGGQLWVSSSQIDNTDWFTPDEHWGVHYYAIAPVNGNGTDFMFRDKQLGP